MLHVFRLLYCLYILAITSEMDSFNGINTEANVPVGVCVCVGQVKHLKSVTVTRRQV